MLEFRLKNKPFALDDTASVRLMWRNPACFIEDFPGDIGLNISIPVNDLNRALLGNPERFEKYARSDDREFTGFEVRYDGYLLQSGTLVVNHATGSNYEAWLRSPLGNIGKDTREKYINELPWPTAKVFTNKKNYSYPDDDYCAPVIHNRAFWESKGKMVVDKTRYKDAAGVWRDKFEEIEHLTKKFRDINSFLVNRRDWQQSENVLMTNEGAVVSPMLYMEYVVKEILRMSGFYINRNDWATDARMLNLFLYNNFNIMYPEVVTMERDDWQWNLEGTEMISVGIYEITEVYWQLKPFDYKDLIPRVKMKNFILGMQNYLNYIFHFRDDKRVNIIDRNAIPGRQAISLDKYFVKEWEIGDRLNRRIKLTAEADQQDGIQGDNWQDLSDRIDDFEASVEIYDDLKTLSNPRLGELRMVRSENKIYEWKWGVHKNEGPYQEEEQIDILLWKFVSTGPQPYLYGSGESIEEINSCFSALTMYSWFPPLYIIPGVRQHGNVGSMRSTWSDFTPRILYNNNALGTDQASTNNGAVELTWEGENGLIVKRWKNWLRFWKDRLPVEAEFDLPLNLIDYVKNNIYEPFSTRAGKFIIEEMEVEFGLKQAGTTLIKGFKV